MDEEILENINERLDETLDRGRQMVEEEELAERIDELKLRAEKLIRKHPVKSVAGGLLAGYIIGKLLSSDD
ncbi:hypothetical protein [Fodinibius halophilus]|uniref:DUF883 domain-containing protein n=1 Tax=Fodinibius halophilus TaxID=1736908 RepID=A0A6M1T804_9BACT|nr:hypothetical protein [Fodinibius halophilus]NGP88101.1 hypothetical protein [Fodinibius halophilus]